MAQIICLMKSKFYWRKRICFWKFSTCKMELHTCKMVASLEYSKIQNLICNNSITHRIMTDTYNYVHMKYNNKHNISQDYGHSVYVALYSRFTWQYNCFLCITYYIKKCHSWQPATLKPMATLPSMSYTLLGGLGIKMMWKQQNNMGKHVFMQASDCIIIYLNKNKFCVALSTICDIF